MAIDANKVDFRTRLQDWLPKLVLSPSIAMTLVFVYGFIGFTVYLSFTNSKMLPKFDLIGWEAGQPASPMCKITLLLRQRSPALERRLLHHTHR